MDALCKHCGGGVAGCVCDLKHRSGICWCQDQTGNSTKVPIPPDSRPRAEEVAESVVTAWLRLPASRATYRDLAQRVAEALTQHAAAVAREQIERCAHIALEPRFQWTVNTSQKPDVVRICSCSERIAQAIRTAPLVTDPTP